MKKILKSTTFNILMVLGFTCFVLWLMLKDNFNEVSEILLKAKLGWILVIVFVALGYQAMIGAILTVLTKLSKPDYRFRDGLINAMVASFFHGVTPSASGGQFAQVYIYKKQGVPISDSAGILWMDFILYQSTMVGLVLILLILRFGYFYRNFSNLFILVLLGFLINSLVIVGLWIIAKFPRIYTWLTTSGIMIGVKLRLIKNKEKTLNNINMQLERFGKETKRLQSHRPMIITVVFLNLGRLLLYYSIPYFCAQALGIAIPMRMFIDVIALSSFVSMINAFIPIPGASGGTEATFVLMFSNLFGKIKATSCMILWRFASYYFIMLLGGIVFVTFKFVQKRKEQVEG